MVCFRLHSLQLGPHPCPVPLLQERNVSLANGNDLVAGCNGAEHLTLECFHAPTGDLFLALAGRVSTLDNSHRWLVSGPMDLEGLTGVGRGG
jgi:hypothetical protein